MTIPRSGKYGVLNGQSTCRNWGVNDISSPQAYKASNTKGGTGRVAGNRDWNGNFANYGGVPVLLPGDAFNFAGYTAPTSGVAGTDGYVWSGPAIVDQLSVNWSWANGEIITHACNISGNGALASASAAALVDETDPTVPPICGTKITYNAAIEWENLLTAALTITAANQAYVNSSTACWTKRDSGPIDWSLAVTEQNHAGLPAALAIGSDVELKLYINATEFWHLKFGHVGESTGLVVDRESGVIIQRTVNIAMNVYASAEFGKITLPGAGTDWWPFE